MRCTRCREYSCKYFNCAHNRTLLTSGSHAVRMAPLVRVHLQCLSRRHMIIYTRYSIRRCSKTSYSIQYASGMYACILHILKRKQAWESRRAWFIRFYAITSHSPHIHVLYNTSFHTHDKHENGIYTA